MLRRVVMVVKIVIAMIIAVAVAIGILAFRPSTHSVPRAPASLALVHEAYVWQRSWDGQVQKALRQHGTNFERLILLAAEVSWAQGKPRVVRAALDYPAVRSLPRPVGLALRIGVFPGPFTTNDPTALGLAELAASLVQDARTNGIEVAEFQLDFDCAESRLAGYQSWVRAIRSRLRLRLPPVQEAAVPAREIPVTITVLPAWLKRREFAALVRAIDGYVLQVHSLERPRDVSAPFTLCDPVAARRWVEQAARLGVPFRVALPTYGYRLAFDASGKFLGLTAEGPGKIFSETQFQREVRSDPVSLAELVREWGVDRPASMGSVIWYRLPVAGDSLNWSWSTMSEVIAGRAPTSRLTVLRRSPQPGLVEVGLTNAGPGSYVGAPVIHARWTVQRFVAADGLADFTADGPAAGPSGDEVEFTCQRPLRLDPGEERWIGWVRLEGEGNVEVFRIQ